MNPPNVHRYTAGLSLNHLLDWFNLVYSRCVARAHSVNKIGAMKIRSSAFRSETSIYNVLETAANIFCSSEKSKRSSLGFWRLLGSLSRRRSFSVSLGLIFSHSWDWLRNSGKSSPLIIYFLFSPFGNSSAAGIWIEFGFWLKMTADSFFLILLLNDCFPPFSDISSKYFNGFYLVMKD